MSETRKDRYVQHKQNRLDKIDRRQNEDRQAAIDRKHEERRRLGVK